MVMQLLVQLMVKLYPMHPPGYGPGYSIKVKLYYAYKVRNIGRVRPRLRFCALC